MKFGEIDIDQAHGTLLAHSLKTETVRLKKGQLLGDEEIKLLRQANITRVTAIRLGDQDVEENEAARRISESLRLNNIRVASASTGRVNFHATQSGLFTADPQLVDAINAIDSSITLATVANYTRTYPGMLVATVKIIPFAVQLSHLQLVQELAVQKTAFGVQHFRPMNIGLIQTCFDFTKESILDKTTSVTKDRIERNNGRLVCEYRTDHNVKSVTEALTKCLKQCDMVVLFGASAVCDPNDIFPQAIRAAGGSVKRIGMPVDPGNLLILAECNSIPVLGAPGCARSPKQNGFDWVLNRLMANIPVDDTAIGLMGVGGLLSEIPMRPSPREQRASKPKSDIAIAVLAAGRSSRMGNLNKLLATFDGVPLIRRSVEAALNGGGHPVITVLGHMADDIDRVLYNLPIKTVKNESYREGMSTSIKMALDQLAPNVGGLMIHLADMPDISEVHIRTLIEHFIKAEEPSIVRATYSGQAGNPVILPRTMFPLLHDLTGDSGARFLIKDSNLPVIDVELGKAAACDVDTPAALAAAGGTWGVTYPSEQSVPEIEAVT